MNATLHDLAGRGTALVEHARSAFGEVTPKVSNWLKAGAAVGATRGGMSVATRFVRRNPALAIGVAAVGFGAIAYAAYRKRASAGALEHGGRTIDGTADEVRAETSARPRRVHVNKREKHNGKHPHAAP